MTTTVKNIRRYGLEKRQELSPLSESSIFKIEMETRLVFQESS